MLEIEHDFWCPVVSSDHIPRQISGNTSGETVIDNLQKIWELEIAH